MHAPVPRYVVEPEQPAIGAGPGVFPLDAGARSILFQGIGAGGSAVESDTGGICLVEIDGVPVGARRFVIPGRRSIMVGYNP